MLGKKDTTTPPSTHPGATTTMSKNEDGVTRVSQSKRRKLNTTDIKNNIECISDALLLVKTRMEDIIRQSCDQLKSAHQCIIEDNEKRLKNAATDGDSTKFGILLLKSLRDIDYTWSTFNETCIPDAMRKCNTELETIHRSLKKIAAYSENISNSIVDAGTDDGSIAIKQSLETLRGRIIGIRDSSQVCPAPVFTGIASSCGTHGGASGEAACHGRHTLPMKRIQQLYSIQHPRVSLYATEYDKVWCFDDIYWSHTPFLHCSIDAELGSCMDRFGSITHFTALHVLHNMGFVAEDIAVVLPYIDNSFYYRVSQDVAHLQGTDPVCTGVLPGNSSGSDFRTSAPIHIPETGAASGDGGCACAALIAPTLSNTTITTRFVLMRA